MKFSEIAPPGREKQVKKLKKKFDDPSAPYAIAWAQHNKHGKPKKKEALGESDDTTYVKMVIQKYPQEWKKFTDTGDLMDAPNIYEKLFVYFHFDTGEMPYGTAKARDGDPYEWIANKLDDLGLVEGKMSEIDLDIKTLSDAEFEKKYGKSKGQMQKDLNEGDLNAWYAEQYAKELAEKEGKNWSRMKYGEQEAYRKIANKKYGVVKSENIKEDNANNLQSAYDKVYAYTDKLGDRALEYLYRYAPNFDKAMDQYGEIEDIEKNASSKELKTYMDELEATRYKLETSTGIKENDPTSTKLSQEEIKQKALIYMMRQHTYQKDRRQYDADNSGNADKFYTEQDIENLEAIIAHLKDGVSLDPALQDKLAQALRDAKVKDRTGRFALRKMDVEKQYQDQLRKYKPLEMGEGVKEQDVPTQKGRDAKPHVLTKRAMNVVKKQIKKDANKERRRMDKDAVGEDTVDEAPFGKAVKSALGRVAQRTATNIKGKLGSIPGMGDLKTAATGQQAIDKTSDQIWNQYVQFKQTGPDKNQTVNWFKTNHGMDVSPNQLDPQGNIDKTEVEKAVKSALAKKQSGADKEQQPDQQQYQFKKGDEIKWTDANGKQQTAKVVDPNKGPGDQQNMMTVQQGNRGTIALSKDKPFPADSEATQDDKVAIAQLQKIDPTANQTTLRAVNSVAGGKPISGQLQQFIQPLIKKITRALKDANKRQKLAIALSESLSQSDLSKLDMLAREGMVPKNKVARFKTAMRTLAKGKDLPISYKDDVIDVVTKLAKIITKPSVMGMVRKGLKENTDPKEIFDFWVKQHNNK